MRKKAGRRIAVLLAVSMMAAQIPAAAAILPKAVSAANGKQPEREEQPEWGMTPPEWNVDEDGGATPSEYPETPEQTDGNSEWMDENSEKETREGENVPDTESIPTGVTEWSFAGASRVVQTAMEGAGACGDCGGIFIDATAGKASPRESDTQINAGTVLYVPVAGVPEDLLGREITVEANLNGTALTASVFGGEQEGQNLAVDSDSQTHTIVYGGADDAYIRLEVTGTESSNSAYFTGISVSEIREPQIGPAEAPEEFPTSFNFQDSVQWPVQDIGEAVLMNGLYLDPAEGSLSLRGTDLMGQGTVYVPVKSGVEASILVTAYTGSVLEVGGATYSVTGTDTNDWPTVTVLENDTAQEDGWVAIRMAASQNYIRSIAVRYAGPLEDPDGSVRVWLFDGSAGSFDGDLQGSSEYFNHLYIDAGEGKCTARPDNADTQIGAGTWIYVPAEGKGELVISAYASGNTVIEADGTALTPEGSGYADYIYVRDSNTLEYIPVYFGGGGTYLKKIEFRPEAVHVTAGTEVWDMGGASVEGGISHIGGGFWDSHGEYFMESTSDPGKYVLQDGEVSIGALTIDARHNDRMYYGSGVYSFGSLEEDGLEAEVDGETFTGAYYANGGGRAVTLDQLTAGAQVTFYMKSSNGMTGILRFADGETEAAVVAGGTLTGEAAAHTFLVPQGGSYTLTVEADGAEDAKLVLYRAVKDTGCVVTGTISVPDGFAYDNFDLYFVPVKARSSGITYQASIFPEENGFRYEAALPEGTYQPVLSNVLGYGFKDGFMVTVDSDAVTADLEIVEKATVAVTGTVSGLEAGTDWTQAGLVFVPDNEFQAPAVMELAAGETGTELHFTGVLDVNTAYTAVLTGLDDYQITVGGEISATGETSLTHEMTVVKKTFYPVRGSLLHLPAEANVTSLAFTEVKADGNQGQSYPARVQPTADGSGQTYAVSLRDGVYQASMTTADGLYETSTHVTVVGAETARDLYVTFTGTPAAIPFEADLYVGYPARSGYGTIGEAMEAAGAMRLTDPETRITVHIYPGVYREQVTVDVPNITFVNDLPEQGDVIITWYYGIGYEYYSVGEDGFYDPARAYDKYKKAEPASWGGTVRLTENAGGFQAKKITFENSFNDYVTEEELADGVGLSHSGQSDIDFERTLGADVRSREATERAAAMLIYADKTEFFDCEFLSSQDTLYTHEGTEGYFKNCRIEGNTDYIFGYGDYYFDACTLSFCGYSDEPSGGYITAAREPKSAGGGYLFDSCRIVRNTENGMLHEPGYFGRPWGEVLNVTFVDSILETADVIAAEGWHEMSGRQPDGQYCHEYGSVTAAGAAVDVSGRVANTVLTEEAAQAVASTPEAFFGADWTPEFVDETLEPEVPVEPEEPGTGEGEEPGTGEPEEPGTGEGEEPVDPDEPGTGEEEAPGSDAPSHTSGGSSDSSHDLALSQKPAWVSLTAGADGQWAYDKATGSWSFVLTGGSSLRGQWAAIRATAEEGFDSWYYFDWNGTLQAGWLQSGGQWYYLNPRHDGTFGLMLTGWQFIDGQWYYFNPNSDGTRGAMFSGRLTPDGYWVAENGQWDGEAAR